MNPHDPICIKFRRSVDDPGMEPCICGELREARENQSELIAQAIEVIPVPHHSPAWSDGWSAGRADAVRVARGRTRRGA